MAFFQFKFVFARSGRPSEAVDAPFPRWCQLLTPWAAGGSAAARTASRLDARGGPTFGRAMSLSEEAGFRPSASAVKLMSGRPAGGTAAGRHPSASDSGSPSNGSLFDSPPARSSPVGSPPRWWSAAGVASLVVLVLAWVATVACSQEV